MREVFDIAIDSSWQALLLALMVSVGYIVTVSKIGRKTRNNKFIRGRELVSKKELIKTIDKVNKKEKINPLALKYINRLSDHLFVAARAINKYKKTKDVLWIPGKSR